MRTLTVLFTDIVGSTELFSGRSTRESDRLLSAHLDELRGQVERFGGTAVKNLGDGVMATFQSARDGLDCAVAMQEACANPKRAADRVVCIRVGVSSGDVRMEGADCYGNPVIEASRLCAAASGGQVLAAESTRLLARDYEPMRLVGVRELKGLPDLTEVWEAEWTPQQLARVRVVLADDAALVREGVARVLEEAGMEVVGQAKDAEELMDLVVELHPDVAVVDVRMPPTHTVEGLEAAERIRAGHPMIAVLVLSQDLQPHYAGRLLSVSPNRVGYLLKERVANLSDFAGAVRRVASGGTAFEPAVISSIVGSSLSDEPIRELTPEEVQTLAERAAAG
jgi:class 3 adenylate cyclase